VLDEDRPSTLTHRLDEVREISIGRHLLEHRAQRRLIRVRARDLQSTESPFLIHHVDGTPVGEILNDEPSQVRQRLVVIERGAQHGSRFRQQLPLLLEAHTFRDVSQRYGEEGFVADLQLRDRRLRREFFAILAQTSDGDEALSQATRSSSA